MRENESTYCQIQCPLFSWIKYDSIQIENGRIWTSFANLFVIQLKQKECKEVRLYEKSGSLAFFGIISRKNNSNDHGIKCRGGNINNSNTFTTVNTYIGSQSLR